MVAAMARRERPIPARRLGGGVEPATGSPGWRLRLAVLLTLAGLLAACTDGGGGDGAAPDPDDEAPPAPSCRHDGLPPGREVLLTGADPVQVAARMAEATHRCSELAVVAPAGDGWTAVVASAVARASDAPLLLVDPAAPDALRPALDRLDPVEIVSVGVDVGALATDGRTVTAVAAPVTGSGAAPTGPGPSTTVAPPGSDPAPDPSGATPWAMALEVSAHLGTDRYLAVPEGDEAARAAIGAHLAPGTAVLPLPADPAAVEELARSISPAGVVTVLARDPATAEAAVATLVAAGLDASPSTEPLWPGSPPSADPEEPSPGTGSTDPDAGTDTTTPGTDTSTPPGTDTDTDTDSTAPGTDTSTAPGADTGTDTVWLVDPGQAAVAAAAGTAASARGEVVLPVTADDLRQGRERTMRIRRLEPARAVLVGDVTADASWQLPLITSGPPLPGGGFRLFEDRRMVALYGHPSHAVLGVLGEQDVDASVERARAVAAPYGADGTAVLPAFEIITTVASAEAGALGDYSRRTSIDVLRPYIDRAAEAGLYVVLDLQPGRTDFLTQAREYEELLREPHVGLALDPEWRLRPDQFHLRQVGSVEAAEVQLVVDWLADLTRENGLPEKLLVLHQFRLAMLPDRDTIVDRSELAMVVHMDGQGPIGAKDGTYQAITAGAEDRWLWGWKNFYDEDQPTPSPEHVLSRDPVPVFVTYQ